MIHVQNATEGDIHRFIRNAEISVSPFSGIYFESYRTYGSEHDVAARIEVFARRAFSRNEMQNYLAIHETLEIANFMKLEKQETLGFIEWIVSLIADIIFLNTLGKKLDYTVSVSQTYIDIANYLAIDGNEALFIEVLNNLAANTGAPPYTVGNFRHASFSQLMQAINILQPLSDSESETDPAPLPSLEMQDSIH